jgi:hypothetical protein
MSLTRARPPTFQRRLRSVTLRQRLTRLLDMVGPQPPLVELLVRHVLLPREVLPQIERNSCAQASRSLGAIRGPGGVSASAILGTSVGGGTCNGVKMVWSSWGRRRRAGP